MTDAPRRRPSGAAVLKPELTEAIETAVLDELAEHGYGRLSMDAVARRAGVGKSALYRRWPGKQDMVVDLVRRLSVPLAETPDTGSLRGDLRAVLDGVLDWLTDPRFGRILPDLFAAAARSAALADALRSHVGEPRRAKGAAVLDRAVARGELAEPLPRELALDLLAAPIHWRLTARHVDVTPDYLDELADAVVGLLKPAGRTTGGIG